MDSESQWSVMKETVVETMEATFRECPQCFFSEHDIHSVLISRCQRRTQTTRNQPRRNTP